MDVPDLESNHREADQKLLYIPLLLDQMMIQVQLVLLQMIRTYISYCYVCLSIALEKFAFDKVLVHPMMESLTMM